MRQKWLESEGKNSSGALHICMRECYIVVVLNFRRDFDDKNASPCVEKPQWKKVQVALHSPTHLDFLQLSLFVYTVSQLFKVACLLRLPQQC